MERGVLQRPKANLKQYLSQSFDFGWTPQSCIDCYDVEFELIDGERQCFKKGYCKHYNNVSQRPKGYLMRYLVGIEKFIEVVGVVRSLMPLDPEGYPYALPSEVLLLPHEVDLDEVEFFDLLAYYMSELRNVISENRKQEQAKWQNYHSK